MSATPGLDTVEGFAALSASLEDPFADRTRLLAAAGVDETDFAELSEHWLARLGAGTKESDALVERYAEAYAKRRGPEISGIPVGPKEAVVPAPVASTPALGAVPLAAAPPLVSSPAPAVFAVSPSFEAERAPPPARGEVPSFLKGAPGAASLSGETSDIDLSKVLSGLSAKMPFDPSRPSTAAVPSFAPSPKAPLSGETVDVNVADLARKAMSAGPPGRPPVPAPAAAPAPAHEKAPPNADPSFNAAPPGKRLIRFDPQTGMPLATPQWVDLPVAPGTPPGKAR